MRAHRLYLDVANYILFTMWIVVRVSLISMILSPHNAIKIPSNKYEMVLEYAYAITQKQLLMTFFNMVLCLADSSTRPREPFGPQRGLGQCPWNTDCRRHLRVCVGDLWHRSCLGRYVQ